MTNMAIPRLANAALLLGGVGNLLGKGANLQFRVAWCVGGD